MRGVLQNSGSHTACIVSAYLRCLCKRKADRGACPACAHDRLPLQDIHEHQHTPSKLAAVQGLRKLLEYLAPLGQKGALAGSDSESGGTASAAEVKLSACHAVNAVLWKRTLPHCTAACNMSQTRTHSTLPSHAKLYS